MTGINKVQIAVFEPGAILAVNFMTLSLYQAWTMDELGRKHF